MTHLLITDSGLGGLSVCAAAERAWREARVGDARITYFNAWPDQASGYNDLPDIGARAAVFDRALAAMAALRPDRIVIACNTLSIVYLHTAFRRAPAVPVVGIVDAGVDLFSEALGREAGSVIVLFGTRTTIESGAHRARLIERGVAPGRIAAVPCHGLAKAIETDPAGAGVSGFIESCTAAAAGIAPAGDPLYLGVCCTHYTYVSDAMAASLERYAGRRVLTLDPGERLVRELMQQSIADAGADLGEDPDRRRSARPRVTVISKVAMDDAKRRSIAGRVEAVSPATAAALLAYTRVPDLF